MELLTKYLLLAICLLYIYSICDILLNRNCSIYKDGELIPRLIERDSLIEDYGKYLKLFNKGYDAEETKWRLEVFKNNVKEINRLNQQGGAKYGWTKFTDVSREELFKTESGTREHKIIGHQNNRHALQKNKHGHEKKRPIVYDQYKYVCKPKFNSAEYCSNDLLYLHRVKEIPDKIDWREKGKVGPVLNQKLCNGCWAFSIVGVMESMAAIQGIESDVVSLSIQEVLDCRAYHSVSGCNYGSVSKHLQYMCNNNISVVKEAEYPLTLFEETCRIVGNPPGRQLGCFNHNTNIDEMDILRLLAFHGPVMTVVNADPWLNYLDGVISESCYRSNNENTKLHVVQIVGYDTTPTYPDLPYYIVRNSWGEDFGIDGYVKLAMFKNICGIADDIFYLMVD